VMISGHNPESIYAMTINPFRKTLHDVKDGNFFFDKLKNLYNYQLKIVLYEQMLVVGYSNGNIKVKLLPFLDILEMKMNAQIKIVFNKNMSPHNLMNLSLRRQIDLTLNNQITLFTHSRRLLTYEEKAHCFLIPKSAQVSYVQTVLAKPFDSATWIGIVVSILALVITWRIFRTFGAIDSSSHILFAAYAFFIGQSVVLNSRNRLILVILLQIMVFMMFILGQGYQGIVTSFAINKVEPKKTILTFDDILKDEKLKLMVSNSFHAQSENFSKYADVFDSGRAQIVPESMIPSDFKDYSSKYTAVELLCSQTETMMQYKDISQYFYIMPQRLLSHFVFLQGGYNNPFMQRFQHYMDLSFEAGLPQNWNLIWKIGYNIELTKNFNVEDDQMLHFEDIIPLFIILPTGYSLAGIVFVVEMLYFKYIDKKPTLRFIIIKKVKKSRILAITEDDKNKLKVRWMIRRKLKVKKINRSKLKKWKIIVRPAIVKIVSDIIRIPSTSTKAAAIEVYRALEAMQKIEFRQGFKILEGKTTTECFGDLMVEDLE
jgi:hypothetical protein